MRRIKQRLGLVLFFLLLLGGTGCSRETVVLDSEDMVLVDELLGETGQKGMEAYNQNVTNEKASAEAVTKADGVEESTLFVHICGQVVSPGVYELPLGSRIYEAVEAAGGFTQEAEQNYVNLAQVLEDGLQIEIPDKEGALEKKQQEAAAADGLVDINTATKQQLCTLPGVGEGKADSIIAYRESNGGFSSIEEIMKVEGIKEGMFARIKDKICVRGER